MMNASLNADMNGKAMALGKKLWLIRVSSVCDGIDEAAEPKPPSKALTGLYPRKAAKSAPVAGTLWNAAASCAGAPVLVTAVTSADGNVEFSEMMITAKNIAWLMVCPQF